MTARIVDCVEVARVRLGEPVPAEWIGFDWYVATVRHNEDYAARAWMEAHGLPVFMMEERKAVRACGARGNGGRGRRQLIDRPLWPGYLFVVDPEALVRLWAESGDRQGKRMREALDARSLDVDKVTAARLLRGVVDPVNGFLGAGGRPARVGGAVMQALFAAHDMGRFVPRTWQNALRRRFAIGQKVAIDDGPFRFVEGVVESFGSGETVEIIANVFGGQVPVKIGLDSLKAIGA